MKVLKKIIAAVCVSALLLTFAGCHKKDETAVTVGDVKFTSAYYMCALIQADGTAKQKIKDMAAEDSSIDTSKDDYYYSQKIDGKDYQTWVKDEAISSLKEIAAYKIKCKEANLEISEADESGIQQYVDYYWNNYGYVDIYEPNGVSYSTYKQYYRDTYYSQRYFEYLYGSEGTKAVSEDEVKNYLYTNYAIADILAVSLSNLEDDAKAEKKQTVQGYADSIKNGSMTFEQAYVAENPSSANSETSSDENGPKDSRATLVGNDKTSSSYQTEHFDTIKAMATNEVKVIEESDGTGILLVVKKEISEDPYYLENMDMSVRHDMKDDEFEKETDSIVKSLKTTVSDYAVNRFKVKKIKYPETTA